MPEIDQSAVHVSVPPPPAELIVPADHAIVLPNGRRSRRFGALRRRGRVEAPRPDRCPNCGAYPLTSRFCPDCGQENVSFKVPLPVLLADVGDEFAKWDGRLARTICFLLFRPGVLTQEYNQGRRTHYLPPFKMYFVASAVFIALLSVVSPPSDGLPPVVNFNGTSSEKATADEGRAKRLLASKGLKVSKADAPIVVSTEDTDGPDGPDSLNFGDVGFVFHDRDKVDDKGKAIKNGKDHGKALRLGTQTVRFEDLKYHGHTADQGQYGPALDEWLKTHKVGLPQPGWKMKVVRRVVEIVDHPANFTSNFVGSLGKGIFFLMPIYAGLLALFFRGQRRYYVEHLIFGVHLHTFAFVLGTLFLIVSKQSHPLASLLLLTYPVYEFLALRRIYGDGKRKTLFKQWLLNQFYGWVLFLALLLLFVVTAATM